MFLAAISRASGVHVVAPTGLHHERYYHDRHWSAILDEDEIAGLFVADVEDGIDANDYGGPVVRRTPHRAGVIKIATDRTFTPREEAIFVGGSSGMAAWVAMEVAKGCTPDDLVVALSDGLGSGVKAKVLTTFTRQLATLVDAGLPLLRGLRMDASRRQDALKEIHKACGDNGCAQYNDFRELIAREDIDAVANDLDFGPGICGKGQAAEVNAGQPTVRIRGINVGGTRGRG